MINSTQHSMRRSRASLLKVTPSEGGRISETIFWTVALGRERSSLPRGNGVSEWIYGRRRDSQG